MRRTRVAAIAGVVMAMLLLALRPAVAAEAVDVALVLAADVSRSIDEGEFTLQRKGYAAAISSPQVLNAIRAGAHGAIALCFVEWAGPDEQAVVAPWMVIRDGESAGDFAAILLKAPRSFAGRTAIGAGIDFAMAQLAKSGVTADRRVIDVSGDGTNNAGRPVTAARDDAVAKGVTINGLAIINKRLAGTFFFEHTNPPGGLPNWYRQHVIGGPNAFLLVVENFETFSDAMTEKLLNEISGIAPPERQAAR